MSLKKESMLNAKRSKRWRGRALPAYTGPSKPLPKTCSPPSGQIVTCGTQKGNKAQKRTWKRHTREKEPADPHGILTDRT